MSSHRPAMTGASLADVLRRQLALLLHHLPLARGGKARSVHQARVASRRLREVLPIAAHAVPAARELKLARMVRRVTGALGPVREIDVALSEFEGDTAAQRWRSAAVQRIRAHLTGERDRRVRDMRAALGRLDAKALEARITALAKGCETVPLALWSPRLAVRLRKRSRAFGDAVRAVGTLYAAEPIHRVRIAGKKLRYTIELAHAAAGVLTDRDVATLRRLQDLLGRLRDLQILEEHVRVILSRRIASTVAPALKRVNGDLEAECRVLHAQFLRRADRWLALADRAEHDPAAALAPRRSHRMARMRAARPAGEVTSKPA